MSALSCLTIQVILAGKPSNYFLKVQGNNLIKSGKLRNFDTFHQHIYPKDI